jgi:fatty acid desaturase
MFRPAPWKLVHFVGYTAIVLAGVFTIGTVENLAGKIVILLVNGLALTSISLLAHDLSHGQIIRDRKLRYPIELVAWGWAFFPPTMWNRLHNQLHHRHPGGESDPDRRFYERERSPANRWYSLAFFPSKHLFPWNPVPYLGFAYHAHLLKHLACALAPGVVERSTILTVRPSYTSAERKQIGIELVAAASLHGSMFYLAGGLVGYLLTVGGPLAISAVVNINYIFTQHALRPYSERNHPVFNTTSLVLPRWLDWHHHYVSHHVEHHFFPSMPTHHHPEVRRILLELAGDQFSLLRPREVYQAFGRLELFTSAT